MVALVDLHSQFWPSDKVLSTAQLQRAIAGAEGAYQGDLEGFQETWEGRGAREGPGALARGLEALQAVQGGPRAAVLCWQWHSAQRWETDSAASPRHPSACWQLPQHLPLLAQPVPAQNFSQRG